MVDMIMDEEQTIKNRILLRESTIRKLTSKYLDLISRFNSLTRNEMAQLIKEILNEIDMIEISLFKAENFEKLKEIDIDYQRSLGQDIEKNMNEIYSNINTCNKSLADAKIEKEYKIHCEEVARIINSYDTKKSLETKINNLEEEISKVTSNEKLLMKRLNSQSEKLSLLVKIVNDLQSTVQEDLEEIYTSKEEKMLIDM